MLCQAESWGVAGCAVIHGHLTSTPPHQTAKAWQPRRHAGADLDADAGVDADAGFTVQNFFPGTFVSQKMPTGVSENPLTLAGLPSEG